MNTPDISSPAGSPGRIIYDGLHLALEDGAGIAGYTRLLTRIARTLGYDIGVVYGTAFTPDKDPLLQEVLFFDQMRAPHRLGRRPTLRRRFNKIVDQLRYNFTVTPLPLRLGEAVIDRQYIDLLAEHDRAFVERNLFANANAFFQCTGKFVNLSFNPTPDVLHCTFPIPLRTQSSRNIYTIHDLESLRQPFVTPESKRSVLRLLKKIADTADHIITGSETSKRDIVNMLEIDQNRVTNTYHAVTLPPKYCERPEQEVADYLDGLYELEMYDYLLYFGNSKPEKNIERLIDTYLSSNVDVPLVLANAHGRHNAGEFDRLGEHTERHGARPAAGSRIRCFNHVGLSALVSLIRGARAVIFPSPYGGFGPPVLEAMMLGTPVVAATSGALRELCGDAALLFDASDVDDMARAIATIANNADLRRELSRRGILQAAKFSVSRYRERIRSLYASLT